MDLRLSQGTWIVTGGTSGLGLATAQAICAEGGLVILVGRDADRASAAAASLPGDVRIVLGDLADPELGRRLLTAADEAPHPVRGALLSVGGPPAGLPTQVTDDDWRASFESVVLGPIRLTRELAAACPTLESVAWVLSTSAKSPITGLTVSNGLRPGLAMLVKDFADELGPQGIRVNALMPGRFDTPRVRDLEAAASHPDTLRSQLTAAIPLGRYGDPAEFGAVAAFVLSPVASYLTGAVIAVDGGSLRAL